MKENEEKYPNIYNIFIREVWEIRKVLYLNLIFSQFCIKIFQ